MSNLKNFLALVSFLIIVIQAQAQPGGQQQVYGEMVLYVQDNVSNSDLDAAVSLINGSVSIYPDVGQNIALIDWYGPFSIDGVTISSLAEISIYIASDNTQPPGQQNLPEIDGGTENHNLDNNPIDSKGETNPPIPPIEIACYPKAYIGTSSTSSINLGIFDTGTEYALARTKGYVFESVIEINGNVDDGNGHGTHVATIIDETYHNAVKNNNLNYVIANSFNSNGFSTLAQVLFDLEDGLSNNILHIVNLSFSYPGSSSQVDPLFLLMKYANNTLFVAAAGNDGTSLDGSDTYFPAAFLLDNKITVGSYSCGERGVQKTNFTNYSNIFVDLLAPGIDISAMDHVGNIVEMTGTSQSTAIVSATAAAIASKLDNFDPVTVKCIIETNVNENQGLGQYTKTGGILNIESAMESMNCSGNLYTNKKIEEANELIVEMFPNPFSRELNVTFELKKDETIQLEIFDMSGKQLQIIRGEGYEGINEYSITFGEIVFQNQYLLRIKTSDSVVTKRVIRIE